MAEIPIRKRILSANDEVAAENRAAFEKHGILAANIMASPGAGKTSVILATARLLPAGMRPAVIEGDLASSIDTETVLAAGIPAVQINTGGNCHLDGPMIRTALPQLPLDRVDLLFIENVGNLVCPAEFDLGAGRAVVVASVPEGHDKPYKYPGMFAAVDAVLLNKFDLAAYFDFDLAYFRRGVAMVNPDAPVFVVSCRSGEGLAAWVVWLVGAVLDGGGQSSETNRYNPKQFSAGQGLVAGDAGELGDLDSGEIGLGHGAAPQ